jgi:rhodanese-related sulfurtransferase
MCLFYLTSNQSFNIIITFKHVFECNYINMKILAIVLVIVLVVIFGILYMTNVNKSSDTSAAPDLIIDVRSTDEWNSGHSDTAVNIPLDTLGARISEVEAYKDKSVVVVCRSGARAGAATAMLKSNGFSNVKNGGAWQNYNK